MCMCEEGGGGWARERESSAGVCVYQCVFEERSDIDPHQTPKALVFVAQKKNCVSSHTNAESSYYTEKIGGKQGEKQIWR